MRDLAVGITSPLVAIVVRIRNVDGRQPGLQIKVGDVHVGR